MKGILLFAFSVFTLSFVYAQPVARVEKTGGGREIILERYTSRIWLKVTNRERYSGYLLEFTGEEFIILNYTGTESGIGRSEKKKRMREIDTAGNMDEKQKHIELLKLYFTDTIHVPLAKVKKLEAEKPFYREHPNLVPVLGLSGIGIVILSGVLSGAKIDGTEDILTASAITGATMLVAAGVINRHYHVPLDNGKWTVSRLK